MSHFMRSNPKSGSVLTAQSLLGILSLLLPPLIFSFSLSLSQTYIKKKIQLGSCHMLLSAGQDVRPAMAARKHAGKLVVNGTLQRVTTKKEAP